MTSVSCEGHQRSMIPLYWYTRLSYATASKHRTQNRQHNVSTSLQTISPSTINVTSEIITCWLPAATGRWVHTLIIYDQRASADSSWRELTWSGTCDFVSRRRNPVSYCTTWPSVSYHRQHETYRQHRNTDFRWKRYSVVSNDYQWLQQMLTRDRIAPSTVHCPFSLGKRSPM